MEQHSGSFPVAAVQPVRHNRFSIPPIFMKFNSCFKIPVQPTILLKSKNPCSRFYKAVELERFITSDDKHEEDEMSETFFKAIEELESMKREPSDVLEEMNSRLSAHELQLILVYFSQDGRDSWCALEVFEWLKKENRVDEETMELMVSIMYGLVKKMIESKRNVAEVADFLMDMDCVGLKPSFSMIEKVICLSWDLGEKEKGVLFVKVLPKSRHRPIPICLGLMIGGRVEGGGGGDEEDSWRRRWWNCEEAIGVGDGEGREWKEDSQSCGRGRRESG